jgi:metallo-beta-lactamase family protein
MRQTMEIEFVGAAQTVTGSMHLVRTPHGTVLLDCGLYQGKRRESYERNRTLPLPIEEIRAVILSHAHIDHSGAIPLLVRNGYRGPIYATPATRDLVTIMLRDAAAIQESDARYLNRQAERDDIDAEPVVPLYDEQDVLAAIGMFHSVPYGFRTLVAPGIALTFRDAGHVLGSALTLLDVDEGGTERRLLFTGDLGRSDMPILRDPEQPDGAHVLVMESTYGDRLHDNIAQMEDDLLAVVTRTVGRGGKVIIPSFALERAQEVIFSLKRLRDAGRLPAVPVYVDSPLTVQLTDVFRLHPECYDADTRQMLAKRSSPFEFDGLHYVDSPEESKEIVGRAEPCVVIAASGMCEAGRVLHHLRATVEDRRNTVLIVGFQAPDTLGRRLVEERTQVRIFGVMRERRAEVVVLNGFSAHADQADLVRFAEACRDRGTLERVALVHGDPKQQRALAALLTSKGFAEPLMPVRGDRLSC